jgi:hypothetical protein
MVCGYYFVTVVIPCSPNACYSLCILGEIIIKKVTSIVSNRIFSLFRAKHHEFQSGENKCCHFNKHGPSMMNDANQW